MQKLNWKLALFANLLVMCISGCGDDGGDDNNVSANNTPNNTPNNAPNNTPGPQGRYNFESAFVDGESSIAYTGQTARQVLIDDLKSYIGIISGQIDAANFVPTDEGQVVASLDFYFRFDGESDGAEAPILTTDPGSLQESYGDISTSANLVGKLAGNDSVTDHKDWTGGDFGGWSDASVAQHGGGIDTPENLMLAFFETIEANALGRADGVVRTDAAGNQLPVYVTESGLDLQQLTQKFLMGAIALSQGSDDYMDDDTEGKGLMADHTAAVEGETYTALEHAWDEAFGYFGAARDYDAYTDDEIAGKGGRPEFGSGYHDTNGDGAIDFKSEFNFGAAVNAAKRDMDSNEAAPTDYTADAYEAFIAGRTLLAATAGQALTDAQMDELKGHRDDALLAWERALAATAVHYVNDTLKDMALFGTDEYDFQHHAKVWGELKGFALGFQFNPHSPLSDDDFAELHTLIGDAPVLADADQSDIDAYKADLLSARALMRDAYGFDPANMGDDNGEGGW